MGLTIWRIEKIDGMKTLRLIAANPAATQITGVAREDALGRTIAEVFPSLLQTDIAKTLVEVVHPGNTIDVAEIRHAHEGSPEKVFSISAFPLPRSCVGIAFQDITERRRSKEALHESEERFRSLFEAAFEGIVIHGNGIILDANSAFEKMSGHPLSELVGKPIVNLMTAESRDLFVDRFRSGGGEPDGWKAIALRNDGTTLDVEVAGKACTYRGRPARVTAVRDISERKRAEEALRESEKRFRSLCESAPIGIFLTDAQGNCIYTNRYLLTLSGLTREECLGRGWTEVMHADDRKAVLRDFCKAVEEGREFSHEFRVRTLQGEWHWAHVRISPMPSTNGNRAGYVGTVEDITERKRVEEALRESEESARWLSNATSDIIMSVKVDGTVLFINDAVQRLLGYRAEDVVGKNLAEFVHPEDVAAVRATADERLQGSPDTSAAECRVRHRDGSWRIVESIGRISTNNKGEIIPVLSTRDITKRKRAEEAVRESEERYRLLAENASDVIWTMDLNFRYTYVSPSVTRQRGYSVEEIMASTAKDTLTPASFEAAKRVLAEELTKDKLKQNDPSRSRTVELEFNCKDGSTVWTEVKITGLRNADGQPVGIMGVSRDITERKRAEEALRQSEERYRNLVENINDAIYEADANGNMTYIGPVIQEISGYKPSEIVNRPFTELIHPDDVPAVLMAFKERLTGKQVPLEYRTFAKSGEVLWVRSFGRAIMEGDRAVGVRGVLTDITERKRVEETLRESEEKYRRLVEDSLDGIAVVQGPEVRFANPALVRMLGLENRADIEGHRPADFVAPEYRNLLEERGHARERGEDAPTRYDFKALRKDGTEFDAELSVSRITYEGLPARQGVIRDITERKRAEEALRESEQKYRRLVNDSLDGIVIAEGLEMKFVNPALLKMFGCQREEEMVGRPFTDFVAPEYRELLVERGYAREKGQDVPEHYEYKALRKDGTEFYVEVSVSRTTYQGRVARQVIVRDITERKRAEEALRASEERYRLLVENMSDVIWTVDMNMKYTYLSGVTPARGYTLEEAKFQTFEQNLTPASYEVAMKTLAEELAIERTEQKDPSRSRTLDLEETCKDGSTIWTEVTLTGLRDPDGQLVGILGVTRDITQRKRAEEALRESEERYRSLIETSPDAITLADLQTNILMVNDAALKLYGFDTAEEVVGRSALEFIAPEDRERAVENTQRALRTGSVRNVEYTSLRKDGSRFPIEMSASLILDTQGNPRAFTAVTRDITDRKQAEEALRTKTEEYIATTNLTGDIIVKTDSRGRWTFLNDAACEFFGKPREELLGVQFTDYLHPDDLSSAAYAEVLRQAAAKGELVRGLVNRQMTPKGIRIVEWNGCPLYDDQGDYAGLQATGRDITERRQMEMTLERAREELESKAERQMRRGNAYGLTFRELTVINLVAGGKSDREIAIMLGISHLTAQKHVANILGKMSAASRTEAGVRAIREGLID